MTEAPDGLRTVCWDLPPDLSMIGKTRALVNEILTIWALTALADDVVLVVGDLVSPENTLLIWTSPRKRPAASDSGTAAMCVS
ncbi:hypothetical protein AB0B89_27625, partial [Sphaerisporangium sp. NPDC049002]|uniref:hypothetical protein n=1 Tax=Sphaerisporangium sp. NPDC049002 TaxID=3155392 RepID=UPI0033C5C3F8